MDKRWTWLTDVKWWLFHRFHPKHNKYHIVRLGPPQWYDRCHAILLANFQLLVDFVEGELDNPKNVQINWEWDEGHRFAIREIRALYFWWKHQRQRWADEETWLFLAARQGKDPLDFNGDGDLAEDEWLNLANFNEELEQRQLERLIRIRRYLWT